MPMLRVLIVEDSEDDAFLFIHELKQGGFTVESRRVDTPAAMSAALENCSWDLILSDFRMPQFTGMDALRLCQERQLDIPFIIISGQIGEETAVKMMKAGAHDYLMKDHLARLVPAVKRELVAAREREIRHRNETTMAHLAAIVESCDDAIFSETLGGTILSWNPGAERMFGYRADEILGESTSILVPIEYRNELMEIRDLIEHGERIEHVEAVRVRKDGSRFDVAITISPIKDAEGRICGDAIVAHDITERKRREKERSRLIEELREALARVKTLSGLLPICSACKKIRNDQGYWEQVETYIKERSDADFTHGICPDCVERLYPEYAEQFKAQQKRN